MTYRALVEHFAAIEDLPIPVDEVLSWIRQNTDHKIIQLHAVGRNKKAFRGACRRVGIPNGVPYSADFDIHTTILYGDDLPPDWKRLVICKEALHVFDPQGSRVNTPDSVARLIPAVIAHELRDGPFAPVIQDHLGAFRALAVLIPRAARAKLKDAHENDSRSIAEIARYVHLPDYYVDIWLRAGDELETALLKI